MLDGELDGTIEKAVRHHIAECASCARYYEDMAVICRDAYVADPEVPSGFRAQWQQSIAGAHRYTKPRLRPTTMIPALVCGIAGIVVLSTVVANPQAFGLGGENLRSETGAVTSTNELADEGTFRAPIVFGDIVLPSHNPKPATQNAEYWEETVRSSETPSQVVTGDIEPLHETRMEDMPDVPEGNPEGTDGSNIPFEVVVPGPATASSMKAYADNIEGMTIREENGMYIEGDAERVSMFLTAFELEAPDGTTKVHVVWQEAE